MHPEAKLPSEETGVRILEYGRGEAGPSYMAVASAVVVSALISAATVYVPSRDVFAWVPGGVFGLCITAACWHVLDGRVWKAPIILIVSSAAFHVAYLIQASAHPNALDYRTACAVAGWFGGSVTGFAFVTLLPIRKKFTTWCKIIAGGTLGGVVFGGLIVLVRVDLLHPLKMFLGFLVWQASVALPLARTRYDRALRQ